jgi:putative hemolysin
VIHKVYLILNIKFTNMFFKKIIFVFFLALLLTACSVGEVQLTTSVTACKFDGINYTPGAMIPVGCNSCVCGTDGTIGVCTENNCEDPKVNLANPAAVKCLEDGFVYEVRDSEDGQFGVCIDEENNECDGWDYFRGECELGDVEIFVEEEGEEVVLEELAEEVVDESEEEVVEYDAVGEEIVDEEVVESNL